MFCNPETIIDMNSASMSFVGCDVRLTAPDQRAICSCGLSDGSSAGATDLGRAGKGSRSWQESGFRTPETASFPSIVNVEVFRGACPCRCQHCPVGLTAPEERAARFGVRGIELALWDRITQEVARHPWATVRLHSVGDPVLWADLAEALDIVRRNQVRSWVFTSAITADAELLDALMRCASVVEVSVNSTNREDYQATKGVDAFALASTNLERLSGWRRRVPAARLIVSRTQSSDVAADAEFVRFWRESGLVDDAFVRSFHSYNGILAGGPCSPGGAKHEPCLVHWARFNVSVEGKAVICFNELFREQLDPRLVLGDVHHERIADIWRGPMLTTLRQAELTGHYDGLPFAGVLPCRHCTSCQPLTGQRQTSEHQIQQLRSP
jgi:hypothetical protein